MRALNKPLVSIIIANFNGEKYLNVCLSSVLKSTFKNFEVIIVDDGSADNSKRIINNFIKKDKRFSVKYNTKNLGAAASRNKAIPLTKGRVIVFLDNDTEVDKDWLTELIKPLRQSGIGAAQSVLLDYIKRDYIQMDGGYLIPQVGWLIPFHHMYSFKNIKSSLIQKDIIGISASLAVKKEVIKKVGLFDAKEAIYTEDLDFCWRTWIAGYRIVLAPGSIVYHWSKSVDQRKTMNANYKQIYFNLAKNSFRSIIKNYQAKNVIRYLIASLFINISRGFIVLSKKKSLSALVGTTKAIFWNLINIEDTLKARRDVQKIRRLKDKELLTRVFVSGNLYHIFNLFKKYTNSQNVQ